jgi:hypothetical protein
LIQREFLNKAVTHLFLVIFLRNRLFALILVALAVGIIVPFSIGYILAVSNNAPRLNTDFTLTATGTAYDDRNQEAVNVSISITGTAEGKLETTVTINARGGDVNVENYGAFSVSSGSGTLNQSGDTSLQLDLAEQYGGKQTTWTLSCKVNSVEEKTFSVTLSAGSVSLPLEDYPSLTNLSLNGTGTLQ